MAKDMADMVDDAIDALPDEMNMRETVALFMTILSAYRFDQMQAATICSDCLSIILSDTYEKVLGDE